MTDFWVAVAGWAVSFGSIAAVVAIVWADAGFPGWAPAPWPDDA